MENLIFLNSLDLNFSKSWSSPTLILTELLDVTFFLSFSIKHVNIDNHITLTLPFKELSNKTG